MDLDTLGWRPFFARSFAALDAPHLVPARVLKEQRGTYHVAGDALSATAEPAGRLWHAAAGRADLPAVGDWVAVEPGSATRAPVIRAVLPRSTRFARRSAGRRAEEQVVAANVDTVFLVMALDRQFNLRRLERFLTAAWESGAQPVVVLTKADLVADPDLYVAQACAVAPGVPVHALSVVDDAGFDAVDPWLRPGDTVALLGSSGAGKSTLTNRLAGTRQSVATVSDGGDRGRHTTSHRELFMLPSGALLMDTPGMRELQIWEASSGTDETFSDIARLAESCRFRDCRHENEPDCAVRRAVSEGRLSPQRLVSFDKLRREEAYSRSQSDRLSGLERKRRWKMIHRAARQNRRDV